MIVCTIAIVSVTDPTGWSRRWATIGASSQTGIHQRPMSTKPSRSRKTETGSGWTGAALKSRGEEQLDDASREGVVRDEGPVPDETDQEPDRRSRKATRTANATKYPERPHEGSTLLIERPIIARRIRRCQHM